MSYLFILPLLFDFRRFIDHIILLSYFILLVFIIAFTIFQQ